MPLADCLKKHKLAEHERAILGLDGADDEAARTAIQTRLKSLETERASVVKQAGAKGVVVGGNEGPAAPGPDMRPLGDAKAPKMTEQPVSEEFAQSWLQVKGDVEGKAININLARLDTPDDVKEAISKTAKLFPTSIDEARRGVVTQETTARLADDLGMSPDTLLERRQGQAFNAEEAFAARRVLASSAANLVGLAQRAQMGSDVDKLAFRRALSVHAGIQAQVSGMTAEAGRALAQFRMLATSAEGQSRAVRELLSLSDNTDELATMIAKLDTPEAVNTFVRQASKATTKDMLMEAWINGLLSGPQTHAANMISNGITALWQIPERFLAAQIRSATGGSGVEAGEATAQLFGLVKGARDGFKLAWQALKSGEPSDAIGKLEVAKHRAITSENLGLAGVPGQFADFLGGVIRLPGRLLMSEDEFFKAIGYRMEVNALAFRQATQEGSQGPQLGRRVAELAQNPSEAISMAAQDAARYQTFTKPLGQAGSMFMGAVNKIPGARLIFPFIRTPTNIMKYVGTRTPLAPLSGAIRADIAAGGPRRDLALARIATGSMIMAVGADMAMEGTITGAGPTDPALKGSMRRTGWQPYSMKIGDTYYSFNRLDPLGATLGLAADAAEIMGQLDDQADADELAAALVMAVSNNVVNKTYLEGFSTLVGAFNQMSPEAGASRGKRVVQQFAGTLVPTFAATVERTLDPTLRDAQGVLEHIRSRIPGYSDDLPPRRNLWGEPIVLQGGLGPDIMSPIYASPEGGHAIDDEIVRLGVKVDMPTRTLGGIELTPQQYSRYVELAGNEAKANGKGLRETLDKLITQSDYQRASDGPDGMKALMIRQHVQAFREIARVKLTREYPELQMNLQMQRIEAANALAR